MDRYQGYKMLKIIKTVGVRTCTRISFLVPGPLSFHVVIRETAYEVSDPESSLPIE